MTLRLRYEIDTARRLREHVHLVDGAGYFFFPGASAARGTAAVLEVVFTRDDEATQLRGQVWALPSGGGVWLELPAAGQCLEKLESAPRFERRLSTEQLVLVEAAGLPAMLCRLRDVSAGGARLRADAADVGDGRVRVALPEAGPTGGQLEACGRVVWARGGEVGLEWNRGDLAARAAVRRLLQVAEEEWEGARTAAHPATCRCMNDGQRPRVLLLG